MLLGRAVISMASSLEERSTVIHNAENVMDSVDAAVGKIVSAEDLQQFYDKWADTYDEDLDRTIGGYNNPQHLVHYVEQFVPDCSARILDMACGTGRVGRLLKVNGYTNVDGHDGNKAMLDIARNHKLYRNYYLEFVTDAPMKTISAGSYDAVIMTGAFTRGHLTAKCLRPIGLCLKPHGLLIIAMRGEVLEWPDFQDMEPTFAELEQEGFWKKRYRGVIEKYCGDAEGVAYVYEKL